MAKQKENTERINTFISADTLEKLRKEASDKGTSVSGLIRMIVLEHINNNKEMYEVNKETKLKVNEDQAETLREIEGIMNDMHRNASDFYFTESGSFDEFHAYLDNESNPDMQTIDEMLEEAGLPKIKWTYNSDYLMNDMDYTYAPDECADILEDCFKSSKIEVSEDANKLVSYLRRDAELTDDENQDKCELYSTYACWICEKEVEVICENIEDYLDKFSF